MKKTLVTGLLFSLFLACFAMAGSAGATTYGFSSTSIGQYTAQGTLMSAAHGPVTSVPMGDKTLSNVILTTSYNANAAAISPAGFNLTTNSTPALDPGFTMTTPLSVGPGGSQDATFVSIVTVNPGSPLITQLSLTLNAGITPATSGSTEASATVIERVFTNPGGILLGTMTAGLAGSLGGGIYVVPASYGILNLATPVSSVCIVKDLNVQGDGAPGATAFINSVTEGFSEVPVPPSILLFAPGLLGVAGIRKRMRR